eukprot:COSAG01_NODE_1098_length_11703_cov_1483.853844_13_plen_72_part_00
MLQVSSPENQHAVMIEAVENQSPDVVIVDEISSRKQAEAARTISQRGVTRGCPPLPQFAPSRSSQRPMFDR